MRYLFIIFLVPLLLLQCRERPRDNIFDSLNPATAIDIGLKAGGIDSTIVLEWRRPGEVDFLSYRIYRRAGEESAFRMIAEVAPSRTRYVDSLIETDVSYSYYITLLGREKESLPSREVSSITGPGHIWMIDGFFFELQQISYDMNQLNKRIFGIWLPENVAFNPDGATALITYPIFNYVQTVLLDTGEELAYSTAFRRPYDAVYNKKAQRYWMTDSSGGFYSLDPQSLEFERISDVPRKPAGIRSLGRRFVVTDRAVRALWLFSGEGQLIQRIPRHPDVFIENIQTVRTDSLTNSVFILSRHPGDSKIYRYYVESDSLTILFSDSLINAFNIDPVNGVVWIANAAASNFEILKLSYGGERLDSVAGLSWPTDIAVNRYNQHIVVSDLRTRQLIHFKKDLQEIGRYNSNGEPLKVYIE